MIGRVFFSLCVTIVLQGLITYSFTFTHLARRPGGSIGTQRAVRKSELRLAAKKVSSINGFDCISTRLLSCYIRVKLGVRV